MKKSHRTNSRWTKATANAALAGVTLTPERERIIRQTMCMAFFEPDRRWKGRGRRFRMTAAEFVGLTPEARGCIEAIEVSRHPNSARDAIAVTFCDSRPAMKLLALLFEDLLAPSH